ncbi:HlyD family type I secretion periplasmic adaptor subunit [Pontibaca methylaminivorans]|uniref:HlyD family type I secretion periplasmic adaptor subunit n=1 Tax=Pontibaca methylaminivorans TaxID=515897 RepID=UPI002FDA3F48
MLDAALAVRRPLVLGLVALALLVFGAGGWAVAGRIAGAVVAEGRIEVERNRHAVQHPEGGAVAEVLVREGDLVAAGAPLLRLDAAEQRSQLSLVEDQARELAARRARLLAERDGLGAPDFDAALIAAGADHPSVADLIEGQRALFAARRAGLRRETEQMAKRQGQIRDQIRGIRAQRDSLHRQIALVRQELDNQRMLLDKGLAQAVAVLRLERTEAEMDGRLGELAAALAQAEGRITEIGIERLKLVTARREEAIAQLRDLTFTEREAAEQARALRERIARMEIRAPVAGRVHGMQLAAVQTVIRPAEPILHIVPQDRPLVIMARIAPTRIDRIFPGQPAMLRFPALDAHHTPDLSGRVIRISADTFEDAQGGASFYRVELHLEDNERSAALLQAHPLLPGMPVEVHFRTGDHAPITYLVKPLTDYFAQALRES